MTAPRLWYSLTDAAAMFGRASNFWEPKIAQNKRPGPDAIPAHYLRKEGGMWFLHRDYLIPIETKPANVMQFPVRELSDSEIRRIAVAVREEMANGLIGRTG